MANRGAGVRILDQFFISLREYGFGSSRGIPGLDGLRALSIAFVLVAHLTGTRGFPYFHPLENFGEFGVRIFFVISGYLITSLLLKELLRSGGISLPRFYFRRVLRLFPASYFLLAATAVLAAGHVVELKHWDLVFGATYSMNYYDGRGWPLGHLWSLAVEEQFYLIWPLAFALSGPVRSRRGLLTLLAVVPVLRLASLWLAPALNFVVWSDALATGCLLALLRDDLFAYPSYKRLLASRWFFLIPLAAVAAVYTPSTKVYWLVSESLMNVAIALCIDWVMRHPAGAVGHVLNAPAVSFAGILSYSLYLWQQMFLDRYSHSSYCAFPLNLILAITLALVSYVLIEAPFLRLRTAIERYYHKRALHPLAQAMGGD
ncbi:MAG TPA: acyltransferase [Bryobacteraceae bacterium]|nr:acyltransferase [Bryobacteraceae bacterium]